MVEAITAEDGRTTVFLSYSRKDAEFVRRLAAALDERGFVSIFDLSERPHLDPDLRLTAQDEWWTALKSMIAASDVMVFIVSPDSAASAVCDDEIAHARSLGKRVIAVLRRMVDFDTAPERLRALNVRINFSDDASACFKAGIEALSIELALDIAWLRAGARLMRQADHWDKAGCPDGLLLRAGAIDEADAWALRRPSQVPEPGPLVVAFVEASRKKERADNDERRQIIGRAFVKPARDAFERGRYDAALRTTAAGVLLSDDPQFLLTPEHATQGFCLAAVFEDRLRASLYGHVAAVKTVDFSSNGERILTSGDHSARVYDAVSGREHLCLRHADTVERAAFSKDGRWVVTTSNQAIIVWDAATGAELFSVHRADHAGARIVSCTAALSPSGQHLVTALSDSVAEVWDVQRQCKLVQLVGHETTIVSACFSPDGGYVLTTSYDNTVKIWSAESGSLIVGLTGHDDSVIAAFSPDSMRVATASDNRIARVWDIATGQELARFEGHSRDIIDLHFAPDGRAVLTASWDRTAKVWEAATGSEIATLRGHSDILTRARFSPDGGRIVTTSQDNSARIWDANSGSLIAMLLGHESWICALAFSPDGTRIATGSYDRTARVWDGRVDIEVAAIQGEPGATGVTWSPKGERYATTGDGAKVWDTGSATEVTRLEGLKGWVRDISFSADGGRILAIYADRAGIWDAETGAECVQFKGHKDQVVVAQFNRACDKVITGARDGAARVWNVATGRAELVLGDHGDCVVNASFSRNGARLLTVTQSLARVWQAEDGRQLRSFESNACGRFSPDGQQLFCASGQQLCLWDVESGNEIARLIGHRNRVSSAAYSPNGALIATASDDSTVRVWDTSSGRERACLVGHEGRLITLSFSADGKRIVTGGNDATARIWDVSSGAEIARLATHRQQLNRHVTHACFDRHGELLATASGDNIVRLWDVARSAALTTADLPGAKASIVVAAALGEGRGRRLQSETHDLLLRSAPDEIYGNLVAMLSEPERAEVLRRAELLSRHLHPHCYIGPSRRNVRPSSAVPAEVGCTQRKIAPSHASDHSRGEQAAPAVAMSRAGSSHLAWASLALVAIVLAVVTIILLEKLGYLRAITGE